MQSLEDRMRDEARLAGAAGACLVIVLIIVLAAIGIGIYFIIK